MEKNKKWYVITIVLLVIFACVVSSFAVLCYTGRLQGKTEVARTDESEAVPTSTPAIAGEEATVSEAPAVQSCSVSMVELDSSPYFTGITGTSGTEIPQPWDLRANGMASWVVLEGPGAFNFGLWKETSPGNWEEVEQMTLAWSTGNYNLQELYYLGGRELNDTLQGVVLEPGSSATVCEHDTTPHGVCFLLECPS